MSKRNRKWDFSRENLYRIIFLSDTPAGKNFDIILLLAILVSVLVVLLESVEHLRNAYFRIFYIAEWTFTILFTIEYFTRIYVEKNKKRYLTSFYGIVDLFSVLPSYLSLLLVGWQYLLVIRVLRLLRVARIFKLTRFLLEGEIIRKALKASFFKILVFIFSVLTLVVIIGSVMYIVEGEENGFTSIPISIYWAIVTLTTVGYGDISPQTPLGQMLASMVMLMGYGIIAVPTGIVTVELGKAQPAKAVSGINCHVCGKDVHEVEARYCSRCSSRLKTSDLVPPAN